MVLHAAKYPHCAVNGLLLTKHAVSSSSSSDAPPPSRTHLDTPPDLHAPIAQRSINFDGNAKWKSTERSSIGMEPGILETASDLVQRGAHRDIVDYDNHLDDLAKDFLN